MDIIYIGILTALFIVSSLLIRLIDLIGKGAGR